MYRILVSNRLIEPEPSTERNHMWLFTKEAAIGITRTVMPFIYGWLVGLIPSVVGFAESVGLSQEGLTVIIGGLVYTGIRALAEKIPQIGYLLVFNTRPDYSEAIGVGVPAPTDPPT